MATELDDTFIRRRTATEGVLIEGMFVISGIIWAGKAQCNGQHNLGIFMFLRKHCFSFPNSCARTNQGCSEAYRLPRKKYGYIHKIIQVIREISRITKWVIATAHNRFLLDT